MRKRERERVSEREQPLAERKSKPVVLKRLKHALNSGEFEEKAALALACESESERRVVNCDYPHLF